MPATVVAVTVVLAAGAAAGAFEATDHARGPGTAPTVAPGPTPTVAVAATQPPPPAAGTAAGSATAAGTAAGTAAESGGPVGAALATPAGVAKALAPLVGVAGLGGRLRVDVIDVATGEPLYSRSPTAPAAPASTAKLLTAAAILTARSADDRFTTRVVAGPGNSVVLIGGGDPTLSAAKPGTPTLYAGAARISNLAAQVKRTDPSRISKVIVDDSLFAGPSILPAWAPDDVPSDYGAAITAVMTDGGRSNPSDLIRSANPDLDAGHALAVALGNPSLAVSRGRAVDGAATLGTVRSAPIDVLVDQMLQESDNVLAEVLGRQVAVAEGLPASFVGATAAIRSVLTVLGVDPGAGMRDASGLADVDRLTARTLTTLLVDIVDGSHPNLSVIAPALPVADWSGTLADRYGDGKAATARGLIRAKTGTLTGVSTLAGYVRDGSGQLLTFALMADRTTSTPEAEAALDRVAARLSGCGCS